MTRQLVNFPISFENKPYLLIPHTYGVDTRFVVIYDYINTTNAKLRINDNWTAANNTFWLAVGT